MKTVAPLVMEKDIEVNKDILGVMENLECKIKNLKAWLTIPLTSQQYKRITEM